MERITSPRVRLEVDLGVLRGNYRKIEKRVRPAEVLSVVKANAYGLGAAVFARTLHAAGCRRFGVADAREASEIVSLGLKGATVQILSSVFPDEIAPMVAAGVVLPVTGIAEANLISAAAVRLGRDAHVHFKVDTAMGRLGIRAADALATIVAASRLPRIVCEGVMTHFPVASDPRDPTTAAQIEEMRRLVSAAAENGVRFRYVHAAASDGINSFSAAVRPPFNLVRAGLDLHGGFTAAARRIGMESVLTFKARIVQVRDLPAGTTVGYGRTFVLKRRSRIAVVAAGYADGVPLAISNRGTVFVNGAACPVAGRVSMDYTSVDVTRAGEVRPGDFAVLLGTSGRRSVMPDDWGRLKGTHAHDVLCAIGPRAVRIYRGGPKAIAAEG